MFILSRKTALSEPVPLCAWWMPPFVFRTGVGSTRHVYPQPDGSTLEIREVWAANLDTEFAIIRELVEK